MTMQLYAHPFSSYSQKALIALYENDIPFKFLVLDQGNEAALVEWAALWPIKRFPARRPGSGLRLRRATI